MNKKRMIINLSAQIISFLVSMGINFVLQPYIVANVGSAAVAYQKMANDFVAYAQIIVSALNTMASRFITISIHQKDYENANKYFTSVLFSNIFISLILLLPSTIFIIYIDNILNIAPAILSDVQVLFMFIFINFFITIISSIFSVSTYATDRLDLIAVKTIESEVIRGIILVTAYVFFKPYLWYVGFASVICSIYLAFSYRKFTKKLLPMVTINKKYFDIKKVWELVSLGMWNSITRLGQALLEQLDVLICNIFITDEAAGVLTIAKTLPSTVTNLMGSVVGIFNPQITIAYAKGNKKELLDIIKGCNRIMIFLLSIPLAFLTAYGREFYELWQPTMDAKLLYELTILTVGTLYVSMSIQVLYHVFIITKKVKANSMVMLSSGVLTTIFVFILLKYTKLGIFAIAGVSTLIGLLRNLLFTPMYAAKSLGVKYNSFYGDIGLGLLSISVIIILGKITTHIFVINSWGMLLLVGIPTGFVALLINFIIILRRSEREMIISKLKEKLHIL